MNKLKSAFGKINPDECLKSRVWQTLSTSRSTPSKSFALASVCVAAVMFAGCLSFYFLHATNNKNPANHDKQSLPLIIPNPTYYLSALADYPLFMIYKGHYYTAQPLSLTREQIEALTGARLGETVLGLPNNEEGIYIEDAANYPDFFIPFGKAGVPVYQMNNYNPEYMLMTIRDYDENGYTVNVWNRNPAGLTISKGSDWIKPYLAKENIMSCDYYTNFSEVIRYGAQANTVAANDLTPFTDLLEKLYHAHPEAYFQASSIPPNIEYKVITFHLDNGLTEELYLQEGGYVFFRHLTFSMDPDDFDGLFYVLSTPD